MSACSCVACIHATLDLFSDLDEIQVTARPGDGGRGALPALSAATPTPPVCGWRAGGWRGLAGRVATARRSLPSGLRGCEAARLRGCRARTSALQQRQWLSVAACLSVCLSDSGCRQMVRGELQGLDIPDEYLQVAMAVVVGLVTLIALVTSRSTARLRGFPTPTESAVEQAAACLLCREAMTVAQLHHGEVRELPNCGHVGA